MGLQKHRYFFYVRLRSRGPSEGVGCLWIVRRKRVFILGPSHHLYLEGCALSKCKEYETPIGNLPLDLNSMFPTLERQR
jgi:predicted class III extradiol MEMO1 family dioxygenase